MLTAKLQAGNGKLIVGLNNGVPLKKREASSRIEYGARHPSRNISICLDLGCSLQTYGVILAIEILCRQMNKHTPRQPIRVAVELIIAAEYRKRLDYCRVKVANGWSRLS